MPWLGEMIDANDRIRAIVQNSLPSMAVILLNALLPFVLEGIVLLNTYKVPFSPHPKPLATSKDSRREVGSSIL